MTKQYFELVRKRAAQKLLFLPHAIRQMSRHERMITTAEVRRVIFEGEIIEDYPLDVRGHSCLILGYGDSDRALHVVCAPKDEYLAIITAYIPNEDHWDHSWETRRKR